ncbi:hypothetical protein ACFVUW_28530 [Streptomyces xiamenensis]|uniref:hypothetical protein n=1 Tax=Streptomyces xiamenensis TaxID=408015 RepID=UPI0036E45EFB
MATVTAPGCPDFSIRNGILMPETDDKRARLGTYALFTAAAALAAVGMVLLLTGGEGEHAEPRGAPTVSTWTPEAAAGPQSSVAPSKGEVTAPEESSQPSVSATPSPVPAGMQEAARAFTIAWASHDARPGRDTSYDDASRRAASYAAGELAADLLTHTSGTAAAQQWLNWMADEVLVSASVLQVSHPAGAPASTPDSGLVRVIYAVTQQPADGPAVESEQHIALELHRSDDGIWRVVGLPHV